MKRAESIFFLLATVAALALPAVPAVQEALTADYATVEAAAPAVARQLVAAATRAADSPQQATVVR